RYSPLARSCGAESTDTTFLCPTLPSTLASSHFCFEPLTTTWRVVGSSSARNTRPNAPLPSCRRSPKSPTFWPASGQPLVPVLRVGDEPGLGGIATLVNGAGPGGACVGGAGSALWTG